MLKKAVQQGRSERRGEEVRTALRGAVRPCHRSWRTEKPLQCFRLPKTLVEPLSEARTKLADFFSRLLVDPRLCAFREQGGLRATLSSSFRDRALREHRSTSSLPLHAFPKLACVSSLGMVRAPDPTARVERAHSYPARSGSTGSACRSFLSSLPLDAAADTGLLIAVDRLPGERRIDRPA